MKNKKKQILIDESLFSMICGYHLMNHTELSENIKIGLMDKIDKMNNHDDYSRRLEIMRNG